MQDFDHSINRIAMPFTFGAVGACRVRVGVGAAMISLTTVLAKVSHQRLHRLPPSPARQSNRQIESVGGAPVSEVPHFLIVE